MSSRIIKVANAYDDLAAPVGNDDRAMERIHLGLGYEYDPRVVDSLTRVLERRRGRTPLTAPDQPAYLAWPARAVRGSPALGRAVTRSGQAAGGAGTWSRHRPMRWLRAGRYGVPVVRWASMLEVLLDAGVARVGEVVAPDRLVAAGVDLQRVRTRVRTTATSRLMTKAVIAM